MESSHPIEIPVGHPSEVDEIFDAISYAKGGSIIRMLQLWIGETAFRNGLHNYLKKFSYSNALTEDLWEELGKESGLPVGDVMTGWTSKMGFPLIEAHVVSWNDSKLVLKLKQSKFSNSANQFDHLWKIPVSYITSQNDQPVKFIFVDKEMELEIDNIPTSGWIKLNCDGVGFYRTKYDSKIEKNLISNISKFDFRNRFVLHNDFKAMAKIGMINGVDYLELLSHYKSETDFIMLSNIVGGLSRFNSFKEKLGIKEKFNKFRRDIFSHVFEQHGYDSPIVNVTDLSLRALLIAVLGGSEHEPTVSFAKEQFDIMVEDMTKVTADLRHPIARVAAKTLPDISKLILLHDKAQTAIDKSVAETSLYRVDSTLLSDALALLLSDKVRPANAIMGVLSFASRPEGRDLLWNMLTR